MLVVKGPNASASEFAFRLDAEQKIVVGSTPVEIDEKVAACYIESGHLEVFESGKAEAKPAKTTPKSTTKDA